MLRQTHSLCLLENPSDHTSIYQMIGKYLAAGYGVIYAVEPDPRRVIQNMARIGIEPERYIENGMLSVLSNESVYGSDSGNLDPHRVLESWLSLTSKMMEDTKAKGVVAIGSIDTFIKGGQHRESVEYEKSVGKKFQTPIEAVCCYTTDSINDMPVSALIAILNAHEYTIHDNCEYSQWESNKIRSVLSSAFNKVLGNTTSDLVLKTLKMTYKLDENTIISRPELLEDVLGRFFKDSSTIILAAVLSNLKKEAAFCKNKIA